MNLKEIMAGLQEKLNADPSKAAGIDAIYQFNFEGDDSGAYNVVFGDGKAQINEGTSDNPSITISMDSADFKDLVAGKLDAMGAFMSGKLKVKGDMSLAMRLQTLLA